MHWAMSLTLKPVTWKRSTYDGKPYPARTYLPRAAAESECAAARGRDEDSGGASVVGRVGP